MTEYTMLETWAGVYRIRKDGVITDQAKHAFTHGHCHSLALALNKITGWPLIGLFHPVDDEDGIPSHVGVQSPQGFLDIYGHSKIYWQKRHYHEEPLTIEEVMEWTRRARCYLEPKIDTALPFAVEVIRRYHPQLTLNFGGTK